LPENDEEEQKGGPPKGVGRDADDFGVGGYKERAEAEERATAQPSGAEGDGEADGDGEDPSQQRVDVGVIEKTDSNGDYGDEPGDE
jgi:hypothetical protein